MKILFLVESVSVPYGGTGLAAQQLAQALSNAEQEVSICLMRSEQPVWPVPVGSRVSWLKLPSGALGRIKYFWQIADLHIDVVHLHGIWNPWWALSAFLLALRGVPFVVSPHGSLEPAALGFKKTKKRLALWIYQGLALRLAAGLVATSQKEADSLLALGFNVSRVHIVPNGLDLASDGNRSALGRLHYGPDLHSGTRTFVFMSRVHPIKGLPLLVKAWVKVKRPDWQIIVAGSDEGSHQAEVMALAQSLGVLADFHFVGPVHGDAKERLLASADVFVLPTHSENFGIVIAEALSHGLPVITTKGAPWPELPEKGCGWWCDAHEESIADALKEAMTLPSSVLRSMGAKGRAWVESSLTSEKIARKAINLVYIRAKSTNHKVLNS